MAFCRKWVFPLLAGLLWAVFLTLDLTGLADSTGVKYAAICLCCATAFTGCKTTDGKLVAAALCLTVAADWFLLVWKGASEAEQLRGIGLFIVVQLIYAYRLWRQRDKRMIPPALFFRILPLCLGLLSFFIQIVRNPIGFYGKMQPVLVLAVFYFCNLIANAGEACGYIPGVSGYLWLRYDTAFDPLRNRFACGLLLFVLCDLCVGACNRGILTFFTWWGSWLFYLPSQVLIVLSQEPEKGDPDEKRF